MTAAGLARGEIDIAQVEVPAVAATGLLLDRLVVRAEHVHLALGLPPRLQAGPVSMRAYVGQHSVDRWVRTARLPMHVALTEQGLLLSAGVGGFTVSEALADLQVSGRFLRLAPKRMTVAGLPTPLVRFLRGYLPLPPLPRGARISEIRHSDGAVAVTFALEHLDEPLTPEVANRLARLLRLPALWPR